MLEPKEIEALIRKPLIHILDGLNNSLSREEYKSMEKVLDDAYKLIRSSVPQKESIK